jgi:hypothetical protein
MSESGHGARWGAAHFAAERGHGGLEEVFGVVLGELDAVGDLVELLHGDAAGTVETVRDADGVDTSVEERLALLEEGPCQN